MKLHTSLLVLFVFISNLLFTGIIFGWSPILLLLTEENQYSELCSDDATSCVAQENQLNLIFTVASFAANAGALPVGLLMDKLGPQFTVLVAAVIEISGLFLMAISDSKSFDMFLPGYTLLAVGGQITMFTAFPVSFLVLKYQTVILACISCLYDGSSIVFLVIYAMHTSFGLTRYQLFMGYALIAVVTYAALFLLWSQGEKDLADGQEEAEENELLVNKEIADGSPYDEKSAIKAVKLNYIKYGSLSEENISAAIEEDNVATMYENGIAGNLTKLSLVDQIRTFEFMYALIFASCQVLRANVYIGTNSKLLINYGDDGHNFLYTKIFSFVLPLGFLFVPAIDHVVEKQGLPISLLFTNSLGIIFNALALIPSLQFQCLVFFIFTGFRAFLYAVISAFNAKTFGLDNLGTIIGIIFSTGSVVNLLEYPGIILSNKYCNGSLTYMYLSLLVLGLALFPLTMYYEKREAKRVKHHKLLLASVGSSGISPVENQALSYRRGYSPSPGRKKIQI